MSLFFVKPLIVDKEPLIDDRDSLIVDKEALIDDTKTAHSINQQSL